MFINIVMYIFSKKNKLLFHEKFQTICYNIISYIQICDEMDLISRIFYNHLSKKEKIINNKNIWIYRIISYENISRNNCYKWNENNGKYWIKWNDYIWWKMKVYIMMEKMTFLSTFSKITNITGLYDTT